MTQEAFGVPALITVTLGTLVLLQYFAASETSLAVRLQVMLSWVLSLSIIALVPADVAATMRGESVPALGILWDLSYWTTFCLTWFILPIHQVYEDAADFSVGARLKTSIRENLIFYAVIVVVAMFGIILLLAYGSMTAAGLSAFGIAASNMFGICTGVFLLGYGLVEVPRSIWRSADIAARPAAAYRRVGVVAQNLEHAHAALAKLVRASETTAEVMPRRHALRWAMTTIAAETPKSSAFGAAAAGSNGTAAGDEEEDDMLDYDYDELTDLVNLRRELNRKLRVYRRTAAQYTIAVETAIEAEAVYSCGTAPGLGSGCLMGAGGPNRRFRTPMRSARSGRLGETLETAEWWWKCRIQPCLLRITAVVLACFSALTVWAESTMWTAQTAHIADLSPFSAMVRASTTEAGLHIAVMVPLGYMCFCAYYSLFRLGMFSFYQLVPKHTDSFSLLVNAALTCRYSAPLSLNFLMLVPSLLEVTGRHTTFTHKMAENVPLVAQHFNAVFPAILSVYCAAIAFNVFDKIVSACTGLGIGRELGEKYTFDADGDEKDADRDAHTADGRRIVERERGALQGQEGNGRIGSGCPYYVEFGKGDIGRGAAEMAEMAGTGGDIERDGLLSRRGGGTGTRSDESRAARWERTKERLGNAVRGGAGGSSSASVGSAVGGPMRGFAASLGLNRGAGGGIGGGHARTGSGGGGKNSSRFGLGLAPGVGGGGGGAAGGGSSGAGGSGAKLDGIFNSLSGSSNHAVD